VERQFNVLAKDVLDETVQYLFAGTEFAVTDSRIPLDIDFTTKKGRADYVEKL
jgi:hypothetical protein